MKQHNSNNNNNTTKQGRGGRNLHIAHRRSPSELTPLMGKCFLFANASVYVLTATLVEQLALQQQIEMLQAQQQQIMAQHQQYAQAGLMPSHGMVPPPPPPPQNAAGLMPPPTLQPSSYMAPNYGQFPSAGGGQQQHHPQPQPQQHHGGHRRAQSSIPTGGGGGGSYGHGRRHSLALNEAKKAAALAQAKRQGSDSSPGKSGDDGGGNSGAATTSSPPNTMPTFKFPASSPNKSDSSPGSSGGGGGGGFRGHGRSQSMQQPYGRYNRSSSPHRGFQFPASPSNNEGGGGGGGHHRSNSRNFDSNWRQPADNNNAGGFVPGHRPRGSFNSSISSMSGFYPQMQGGNNVQGRKSLFAPYLPQASLPGLLDEGRLVAGTLRVNKKNRSDAYVSTNGLLDADIFICGSKDRNRALEGDLVAVELLEVDEVWGSKKEKEEKKRRKDNEDLHKSNSDATTDSKKSDNASGSAGGDLKRKGSLKQRPTQKKNDDVEVEGQSLLLVEEEELTDEVKPLYAGHVVAVIERIPGQMFSGTLGLLRPSSQATKDKQDAEKRVKGEPVVPERPVERPKIVWFKPTDKRVPLIAIPTEQAPRDFVENHEKYADRIFIASIKRWPITSLHPFGTLVEELGPANNEDLEVEAILRDNNFTADQFPESVQRSLGALAEQSELSQEDLKGRVDFTSNYTVSITPSDNLLDEAIHVEHTPDGNIELGIHISDVTHYVKNNSPLDREAKKRASSVFLKQRSLNIFPDEFNQLTGLSVGKTSPTISVIFEIDMNTYEVTDSDIKLGYIKPQSKMNYNTVESILNEQSEGVSQADLSLVKTLNQVASQFRQQRFGAKSDGQTPILGLLNQVDDENVRVSANIFDGTLTQQLLDEINIKTNCVVAQKLNAVLREKAFLRRNPEPILQRLEAFSEIVRSLDLGIDTSSSAALQKSLFNIESREVRQSLETLLWKSMPRAKYFVAGKEDPENYGHYYYNVPLYTHFTAPLRRYADIIVHNQIKSVLTQTPYEENIEALTSSADYCNFKKDAAKNAQEQSIHLYLCQVLNKLSEPTGQLIQDAIVLQVYESAFDVFIPEFGIEKRVHGDQLPLVKAEYHKASRLLELFWEKGVDTATFIPEDEKSRLSHNPAEAKEKYRATSAESAESQQQNAASLERGMSGLSIGSEKSTTTDESEEESKSLPSTPKQDDDVPMPQRTASMTEMKTRRSGKDKAASNNALNAYFKGLATRVEGNNYVQEIRTLQHVPVLLRAEVRKSSPCLTVRALNPFSA
jgi:protein SSD1